MEVSLRAYARHRGVSLGAVQKAIKSRRIQKTASGQIDAEAADVEWERNTAPRPSAAGESKQQKPVASPEAARLPNPRTRIVDVSSTEGHADSGKNDLPAAGSLEYSRARAVRENYNARLAKIQYEERVGRLISVNEVQVSAFNKFRQFRDQMLNIPDRVAAMLAANSDPAKVHEILGTEIRSALEEFADAAHR